MYSRCLGRILVRLFYFIHHVELCASTSLLYRYGLLDSLSTSVCLVYQSVLSKCIILQVRSVVVISDCLLNSLANLSEGLVDGCLCNSSLRSRLRSGLGVKNSGIILGCNSYGLGGSKSRVLVGREGTKVILLNRETHGSRTSRTSIDLLHEGIVVLYDLPNELIRNCNHYVIK